jgi:hypothetical protein
MSTYGIFLWHPDVYIRYKQRWASNVFKPQIRKCSCFIRKSANFLQNTAQLCRKTPLKIVFLKTILIFFFFGIEYYMLYLSGGKVCICELSQVLNPQITRKNRSANRKSAKVPHLWKARKSKKLLKSANLRICYLRNLFEDHPPLCIIAAKWEDYAQASANLCVWQLDLNPVLHFLYENFGSSLWPPPPLLPFPKVNVQYTTPKQKTRKDDIKRLVSV